MPTYLYKCKECEGTQEVIRHVDNRHNPLPCIYCKGETFLTIGTPLFKVNGQYTSSTNYSSAMNMEKEAVQKQSEEIRKLNRN